MTKLDKNKKIGLITLAVFGLIVIAYWVLIVCARSGVIPDIRLNTRFQGMIGFILFLPLIISLFFWGKYFRSKSNRIGFDLIFAAVGLFIFSVLNALLSFFGAFGA